jgi:hypothetical protein
VIASFDGRAHERSHLFASNQALAFFTGWTDATSADAVEWINRRAKCAFVVVMPRPARCGMKASDLHIGYGCKRSNISPRCRRI